MGFSLGLAWLLGGNLRLIWGWLGKWIYHVCMKGGLIGIGCLLCLAFLGWVGSEDGVVAFLVVIGMFAISILVIAHLEHLHDSPGFAKREFAKRKTQKLKGVIVRTIFICAFVVSGPGSVACYMRLTSGLQYATDRFMSEGYFPGIGNADEAALFCICWIVGALCLVACLLLWGKNYNYPPKE